MTITIQTTDSLSVPQNMCNPVVDPEVTDVTLLRIGKHNNDNKGGTCIHVRVQGNTIPMTVLPYKGITHIYMYMYTLYMAALYTALLHAISVTIKLSAWHRQTVTQLV